ncbi:SDR family oxidoreductase [Pseudonocardia sp. EV170527-09]|uniref:SDR family oxidoreductase n=1 Tax=Pseudonocardia sp. EV170527-09 TaxID=2603411 RepID=UPI001EFF5FDC|nr:SDR family NAD(P)-dependent oxidoreductase [Pseudonocardia sp. EV170527-09]
MGEAVPRQLHFTTGGLRLSARLTAPGRDNLPGHHIYAATKHGVGAFSEALRQEYAERHVRVGLVEPGLVTSEMTTSGAQYAPDVTSTGERGVLQPADIADAVVYIVTRPRHVAVNEVLVRPVEQVR